MVKRQQQVPTQQRKASRSETAAAPAKPEQLVSAESSDLGAAFEAALTQCDGVQSFADADKYFARYAVPILHALLRLPLEANLADNVAPTSCCSPHVLRVRKSVMAFDDVKFFTFRHVAGALRGAASPASATRGDGLKRRLLKANTKRERAGDQDDQDAGDAPQSTAYTDESSLVVINAYCLLYGITFGKKNSENAANEATVRWPALIREKSMIEKSEAYANANAAERRSLALKSVMALFSDRGRRHEFSGVWSAFTSCDAPGPLRLHFLTAVGTHILPFLTRPVVLSDYLTECFAAGGLTAVLALEGLFVLMLEHDLEYPSFYDKLYSLVTPDAFSTRHRNQLFRLVNLALTSVRVPAYVVAGFIKRICRVLLLSPMPTFYFALPFVRQLFQRHSNCLPLIHRTDGAEELFDGRDPYLPFEDSLEKCRAIDSTLWELCILERHFLPAVNLMVSAYSSPAQDTSQLRFDKTYGRLFAHEITRSKPDDPGVISYKAPAGHLLAPDHKEPGLAGVFVA